MTTPDQKPQRRKIEGLRQLINHPDRYLGQEWVLEQVRKYAAAALEEGTEPEAILRLFGLECLATPPRRKHYPGPKDSPELDVLKWRYSDYRGAWKTDKEKMELRDLAEAAVAAGVPKVRIQDELGVSKATVRNLLCPGYQEMTPEERRAYRVARREIIEVMKEMRDE